MKETPDRGLFFYSSQDIFMDSFSIWHWLIATNIVTTFVIGTLVMEWQKSVPMSHPLTGQVRQAHVGYCWTYLFLGWLVPVSRGEVARGLLHFVLTVLSLGIFQIVMPFLYNKQHLARLVASGWQMNDSGTAPPLLPSGDAAHASANNGTAPGSSHVLTESPILGQIQLFAFNYAPHGWLPCDGTLLEIKNNLAFFALLGTTYGGDGKTHFALPNLKGKEPVPGSVYCICENGLYPSRMT